MKALGGFLLSAALVFGLAGEAGAARGDRQGNHDGCYGSECYEHDYGGHQDNERRNRGAFSPGPFQDSPVDAFNNLTICLPGSTCNFDGQQEEQQPQ